MGVFGWLLFVFGAFLIIGSAVIGVAAGTIRVTNLAGTLTGVGLMISGAVFVVGDRLERVFKPSAVAPKEREIEEKEREDDITTEPTSGALDKAIMAASFGLVALIMGAMVVLAIHYS